MQHPDIRYGALGAEPVPVIVASGTAARRRFALAGRAAVAVGCVAAVLCVAFLASGDAPGPSSVLAAVSAKQPSLAKGKAGPPPVRPPASGYTGPKVKIDFYMEAMCPGCKYFGTGDLVSMLNGLADYVTLRAIPYGNAALNTTVGSPHFGEIACQHGPDECLGNKIELCMMHQYPDWTVWFPAFKCIEKSDELPYNASVKCLPENNMDLAAVLKCANGPEGEKLHQDAGKETANLSPPHSFTPWLVVDGTAMNSSELLGDLVNQVCTRLPGDILPSLAFCHPRFKQATGGMQLYGGREGGLCYPAR